MSLFEFHKHSDIIYLLLYLDDIIITTTTYLLNLFTCKLNSEFATKDLGPLSYFLGLEATTVMPFPAWVKIGGATRDWDSFT